MASVFFQWVHLTLRKARRTCMDTRTSINAPHDQIEFCFVAAERSNRIVVFAVVFGLLSLSMIVTAFGHIGNPC
jgi:hypothetical protein